MESKPMTTNEPTTGEIVRALRNGGAYFNLGTVAADRLESQERSIEEAAKLNEKQANTISALTARAEQAERERDAAVNALTLYEDALFDECDKSYQSGFMDGFRSREEIDDED